MVFDRWKRLAPHPNGMRFQAFDAQGNIIDEQVWYSIGGGFIRRGRIDDALISNHEQTPASSQSPEDSGNDEAAEYGDGVPYPFVSCDGLIDLCRKHHLSIADVVWANETARRSPQEVRDRPTPTSPWHPTSAPEIEALRLNRYPTAPAVSRNVLTPSSSADSTKCQ